MPRLRQIGIWALLAVLVLLLFHGFQPQPPAEELSYSDFMAALQAGKVARVDIEDNKIRGKYKEKQPNGKTAFFTYFRREMEPGPEAALEKYGVPFGTRSAGDNQWWMVIVQFVPYLLLLGFFLLIMRQASSGQGQAFAFGRSKHKLISENRVKVTFEDVAGVEEAKQELREVVDYLKYPKKYQQLGARIPKGVLLLGAPGTGKTLLGRAVAGEAGVPFYYISGSDFVEMFVGVGASRVRDLFDQAKKTAPCIVFVDEIDAVGRQRGAGLGGGHDEREQTLNQLLVEMDGFDTSPSSPSVIVLAATNRPDVLDPALLRPGRFDRQVVVDKPDIAGRLAILKVHSRGKPLGPDVDLQRLAQRTPGFSGADLENLLNEAAILAARAGKDRIEMADCEEAIDRVLMGPERKSRILSDRERETTAYHEAGHAIVARALPDADPVRKVTILPRGMALGVTWMVPEEDRYNMTREELKARITVSMAGRVAEEIVFGEINTGAANDIERATELARDMVCRFGMSEILGPVHFGRKQQQIFLGRDIVDSRNFSEETARQIDSEVRRLIDEAYGEARKILTEKREHLELLARELIRKEVLESEDLERLLGPAARDTQNGKAGAVEPVRDRPGVEWAPEGPLYPVSGSPSAEGSDAKPG
ncbi:MAG TPA: ATP-dependent zinc metalloprotease FtsH [Candidatus Nitrosotenuis sp.]|nr:ATP-dependent zinc metalloprotease FtsH [Candidatus Nitrosotenuis sp.]